MWMLMAASLAADGVVLGEAGAGKEVFTTYCETCHGPGGKGDGPAGKALPTSPRDFTDSEVMAALTDEHLISVISGGGKSVGKSPLMPKWGKALTAQQIKDVAAYVRAFSGG